jgi:hypothetical protein
MHEPEPIQPKRTEPLQLRLKKGILPKTQVEYTYPDNTKKIVFVEYTEEYILQINNEETEQVDVIFSYDLKPKNDEDAKEKLNKVATDNDHYIANLDYDEELFTFFVKNRKEKVIELLNALPLGIILSITENIFNPNVKHNYDSVVVEGRMTFEELLSELTERRIKINKARK